MTATVEERKATNKALIDEVLKAYPEKMAKRRAKHLSTFEEGRPDCVILDICIPGSEGGLAYLRRLRSYCHKNPQEQTRIRKTPVIMLTGTGAMMKPIFEREEISGFIEKPFDLANLQTQIEQIVWKR